MYKQWLPQYQFEPDKLVTRLDILFSPEPGAIAAIVQAILTIATDIRWTPGNKCAMELALREALASATLNGRRSHRSRKLRCRVACDQERGIVIVLGKPRRRCDLVSISRTVVGQNVYSEPSRTIWLINRCGSPSEARTHRPRDFVVKGSIRKGMVWQADASHR